MPSISISISEDWCFRRAAGPLRREVAPPTGPAALWLLWEARPRGEAVDLSSGRAPAPRPTSPVARPFARCRSAG